MGRAAGEEAAGGRAALAASCVTDRATLQRLRLALPAGMAGAGPLSRHEHLALPAESLGRLADQVPRWREFEDSNPDVTITFAGRGKRHPWVAQVAADGQVRTVAAGELAELLDELESMPGRSPS